MEDLSEDSFYFFYKANLIEKVDFQKKLNSAHDFNSTEERWEVKNQQERSQVTGFFF